jgi:hypothetical protein
MDLALTDILVVLGADLYKARLELLGQGLAFCRRHPPGSLAQVAVHTWYLPRDSLKQRLTSPPPPDRTSARPRHTGPSRGQQSRGSYHGPAGPC